MNALNCAYSIEGKGPAVFLVHGVGARRQVWAGVVERLKFEFRCISYDLRGHGDSPKATGPFGLDDLVAATAPNRRAVRSPALRLRNQRLPDRAKRETVADPPP
jgi:pimeloyl-ACP methyl ester carboxylesterase